MIDKTVKKIEETVSESPSISKQKKDQLLILISELKNEINKLSESDQKSALDIAHKTHASAHHATRSDYDEHLLSSSLAELKSTVDTFEVSHPNLVSTINSFCNALANIGI